MRPAFLAISTKNQRNQRKKSADFADVYVDDGDSYDVGNLARGLLRTSAFSVGTPRIILVKQT